MYILIIVSFCNLIYRTTLVHHSSISDTLLACCNLKVHQLILIIFARNVTVSVSYQMLTYFLK